MKASQAGYGNLTHFSTGIGGPMKLSEEIIYGVRKSGALGIIVRGRIYTLLDLDQVQKAINLAELHLSYFINCKLSHHHGLDANFLDAIQKMRILGVDTSIISRIHKEYLDFLPQAVIQRSEYAVGHFINSGYDDLDTLGLIKKARELNLKNPQGIQVLNVLEEKYQKAVETSNKGYR